MEYGYKYAQLGEEQRMNDFTIADKDRNFQQAVKEFEAETGLRWAELDFDTQKELFDRYDADRKYNLSVYKAGSSGGGTGGGLRFAAACTDEFGLEPLVVAIGRGACETGFVICGGGLATYPFEAGGGRTAAEGLGMNAVGWGG